jgi:glycolate oxidase iron-sulfur subunit
LKPSINEAAARLLARSRIEVVPIRKAGCCGALVHHMGREAAALAFARANIDAWTEEIAARGLDAILITASGCGTTIKDYGFMLRDDAAYAGKAARVAALAKDITEYLAGLDRLPTERATGQVIAYHSACSMQHGQQIIEQPKKLLRQAGFVVKDVPEGHICCGSAGAYNMLQPAIASRLGARKVARLESTKPAVIATGNIGCITQIAKGTQIPVVHSVELLDWASGGKLPEELRNSGF